LTTQSAKTQWLNQLTPGISPSADGKPNLNRPAPRAADGGPDFSEIWNVECGRGCGVESLPLFDLAQALTAEAVGSGVQNGPDASVEEVYVFRTIRMVRVVGPEAVEFCRSRVAFTASTHDTLDLVSVSVDANGLVADLDQLAEVVLLSSSISSGGGV
jgi:hypothetical protein